MHEKVHKSINDYNNLPWSLLMSSLGVVGTDGLAPRVTHLGIETGTTTGSLCGPSTDSKIKKL